MDSELKKCSKCSVGPASNGHAWCRKCRSDHERDRQATQAEIQRAQWFQRGATAVRLELAACFDAAQNLCFDGRAVADFIRSRPSPPTPED